ncbi:MAG: HlyD family efflux transporter periplasmic adaptor subunit [Gammaproteobacteria bacterium]|nr:HlyD family efflux transporter periplasmic adaptor subunit [Gammaproteobacteria bacterium]
MTTKKRQIFRKEVINAMTSRHGEIVLIRPVSFTAVTVFIAFLLFCIFLFLIFGQFTRSIPVKGVLRSSQGDTEVMPYQPGIVDEMFVEEGQYAEKGTPLYKIRTDKQGEDGSVNTKLILSLKESIDLMHEKIAYQEELNELDIEELKRSIVTLKSKADNADEEIEIKNDYMKLLSSELSIISKLKAKKQVTQTEYNVKYAQLLEARLALKALKRSKLEFLERAESAEKNIRNITVQGKTMIVEYQQRLTDLQRELASKESDKFYIITAPKSGVAANVFAKKGTFVEVNKPLMVLQPKDNQLVAEVYIPTSAIGQVKVGNSIKLRYQAFPYQKFGMFAGEITNISSTLIQPYQAEVEELVEAPSYRAIVQLKQQNIDFKNTEIRLQTGMLLDADVIGDTRSMLGWIFEPVASSVGS